MERREFIRRVGRGALCALGTSIGRAAEGSRGAGGGGAKRPNFLVILADDMGFSDAGSYGGEIQTPAIDRLAANGLRFTQGYSTARCWPSRACILTGYYAQHIRRDTLPGLKLGARPAWARLLPDLLKPLGYRSYHSGKWHVDGTPLAGGFDRSYVLADHDRYFSPKDHSEDDKPLPPVEPGSGYYATTAIADHAIRCLDEHAAKEAHRPFFLYLAFTSPHFPLHAPEEDIARCRGRYRRGWDAMREERWRRLKEMGIVNCGLSPRDPAAKAWADLGEAERKAWEVRMEIHAAMIERMDREIGRVVDRIRAMGELDDTVIFFASDNGASAERILRGDGHDPSAPPGSWRSYLCIETGWANLANAPFRRHKIWVHEGGISTPWIVHWPAGIRGRGELRHDACHLIDIPPTILELAGASVPASRDAAPVPPMHGRSIAAAFARDGAIARDSLFWFHSGNRAIRAGDWKLVAEGTDGPWELYDLSTDRSESKDLASKDPRRVEELAKRWERWAAEARRSASEL